MGGEPASGSLIGARTVEQVEAMAERLTGGAAVPGTGRLGALTGYRWALALVGAASSHDSADVVISVERCLRRDERAALACMYDPGQPIKSRTEAAGWARALAWVLGDTEEAP